MKDLYFKSLNPLHKLFEKLIQTPPAWWTYIKENTKPEGFYVDVRKDNSLNIYYKGGSLLKITLVRDEIKGKIHASYLGETGSKYIDYELSNLPQDAHLIKSRIASRFCDSSESGIKAKLITAPGANYIDSEFAYPQKMNTRTDEEGVTINSYQTTRIDLVKLENNKIVFVELKRIGDGRLLTREYKTGSPEILSQIHAYHQFINAHKKDIAGYYKKLFLIKRQLGILPNSLEHLDDIDDYELSENVELYIDLESYLDHLTRKRQIRIESIKAILDNHKIIHNL